MVGTLLGLHDSEVSDKPLGELGVDGGGLDDGVGRSACIFMSSSTALLLFFVVDLTLVSCSDDIKSDNVFKSTRGSAVGLAKAEIFG